MSAVNQIFLPALRHLLNLVILKSNKGVCRACAKEDERVRALCQQD